MEAQNTASLKNAIFAETMSIMPHLLSATSVLVTQGALLGWHRFSRFRLTILSPPPPPILNWSLLLSFFPLYSFPN